MRRQVVLSVLVFIGTTLLALSATMFMADIATREWRRIFNTSAADAFVLTTQFIAFGLPVAIGMFAASYTARMSAPRPAVSFLRSPTSCLVSAAITSVGAIVIAAFGGWVATIVYFLYFVAVALVFVAVAVVGTGAPFSRRASAVVSAAVVVSAVVLGTCFSLLTRFAAAVMH